MDRRSDNKRKQYFNVYVDWEQERFRIIVRKYRMNELFFQWLMKRINAFCFRREVSYKEGEELAKQHNMYFIETSAKTRQNVDQVYEYNTKIALFSEIV